MTRKGNWSKLIAWVCIFAGLLLVACSSESPNRGPEFLDSEVDLDPDAEAERLRKLQLIRVWVKPEGEEGKWEEMDADALTTRVYVNCHSQFWQICSGATTGPCRYNSNAGGDTTYTGAPCSCVSRACTSMTTMCTANMLTELASPRSGTYDIHADSETLRVPVQSASSNAAMLRAASPYVNESMHHIVGAFTDETDVCFDESEDSTRSLSASRVLETDSSEEHVLAEALANTYVEGYHLQREITERYTDATLAVADWQRSHPSLKVQVERSVHGAHLSRSDAANWLVGGNGLAEPEEGPSGKMGLCTSPELSGPARRAVQVIREAAPPPADVWEGDIGAFLNKILSRLKALKVLETEASLQDMLAQFHLRREDFSDARAYLTDEFRAYSRTLQPITLTEGFPPGNWFAATASPPPAREAAFYAALARTSGSQSDIGEPHMSPDSAAALDLHFPASYAGFIDASTSLAQRILKREFAGTIGELVHPVIGALVARGTEERVGRWRMCPQIGTGIGVAAVHGFGTGDGLVLVRGEEGLQCGVQGTIEGTPCELAQWVVARLENEVPSGADDDFDIKVSATFPNPTPSELKRFYYLLKPRVPGGPEAPGQYVSLAASQGGGNCRVVSLVPHLEERVAEILKPSKKWCSQNDVVSCAGEQFDARLPLEDELLDPNSGTGSAPEKSWRLYLDLAKQAVAEADLLGEQFVNQGIDHLRRQEDVELREHAQKVAALQELENLQGLCGTSIDIEELDLDPDGAAGTPCGGGCPSKYRCFSGRCIPNIEAQIEALAASNAPNASDYRRLATCIAETETVPFVALGDHPLEAWYKAGDKNTLCLGPGGGAHKVGDRYVRCPVLEGQELEAPGTEPEYERVVIGEPDQNGERKDLLGYFRTDTQVELPFDARVCNAIRSLRRSPNLGSKLKLITGTNMFHPAYLAQVAVGLGWEARLGGYGALTLDGVPLFETGRITGGGDGGWPCNSEAGLPECNASQPGVACCESSDEDSFFCSSYSCEQTSSGIPWTNQRLRNALIALRLSLGMNLSNISFPFRIDDNYGALQGNAFDRPYNVTRVGPNNAPIIQNTYVAAGDSDPFPTIVSEHLDAPHTAGWCYGADAHGGCPGGGAGHQYYGWGPGVGYSFATSELGDVLLASFGEQRTITERTGAAAIFAGAAVGLFAGGQVGGSPGAILGGVGGALTSARCSLFGKGCRTTSDTFVGNWGQIYGYFDGNLWVWGDMTSSSRTMRLEAAKTWFGEAPHPNLGWGAVDKQLYQTQERVRLYGAIEKWLGFSTRDSLRFSDGFQVSSATHRAPDIQRMNGLQFLDRAIDIGREEFLDGLELACDVFVRGGTAATCTVPEFNSVADLSHASQHLNCMGKELSARMAERVLTHVPRRAVDALRRESSVGAFPAVGGDLGEAISLLRGALIDLADVSPQVTSQLEQMSNDVDAVRIAIQNHQIASQLATAEFQSLKADRLAQCAVAAANTYSVSVIWSPGQVGAAAATCANSFYQVELGKRIETLKQKSAELASEGAIVDFNGRFQSRGDTLERLNTRANEAIEQIDAQLARIENIRRKAVRSLHRALYLHSFQAEKQMEINTSMRQRFNTAQIRYEKAFKNAQRQTFIAKRAIEQRLGMRLGQMYDNLPLVDAPNTWETQLCSKEGIDWSRIVAVDNESGDPETANFADEFIGDYLRNLENVVLSYRMVHPFHEGTDTAVISLRDDVYRTRRACNVRSENLLYQAGEPDVYKTRSDTRGWRVAGCASDASGLLPDCVDVEATGEFVTDAVVSGSNPPAGYLVTFGPRPIDEPASCDGCGLLPETRIRQEVQLRSGRYRLSWYAREVVDSNGPSNPTGAASVAAFLADGSPVPAVGSTADEPGASWTRYYRSIEVPADQVVEVAVVPAGTAPHQVELGGFLLEQDLDGDGGTPGLFASTGEERVRLEFDCHDADGSVFREFFKRGCRKLCPNGFDGECSSEATAAEHCYQEAHLNLNQRDIESGLLLRNTGFARGNFNYRIESMALNFVGTGLRDCSGAAAPASCFSRGYIPYSLTHAGPFFIRNHLGQDFRADLFTGNIEFARGLGSERYISNPISSADRELLGPYTRFEYQGRPIDGNFTVRVWDDEGIDFSRIEDIQVILTYRYWTRFN